MTDNNHILDANENSSFSGGPSFSVKHRLFRVVFGLVWFFFARWTPPPFHRWRVAILNFFGANIATTARVYACAKIWYPPNLTMAQQAVLGRRVTCYCMDEIEIGERSVISQGAHLCAGSHRVNDPNFQLITKPITIGAKAWVAADAFIGPGIVVGEGAILGARGVAAKNLEPWTIYGGNPARTIGQRAKF